MEIYYYCIFKQLKNNYIMNMKQNKAINSHKLHTFMRLKLINKKTFLKVSSFSFVGIKKKLPIILAENISPLKVIIRWF